MALSLLASNNAQTVLSSGISSTATTLTVNTGTGSLFPSPVSGVSFFKLTLIDAATGTLTEIVHVTQRSGDTMTIVRGQEGTSSRIWSANDIAANMMTAGTLRYVIDNFAPIESPALTGTPTAPTATLGTGNTQIATTAFVKNFAATQYGRLIGIRVITTSGTYTPIAGTNSIVVEIQGAGGGGGGANSTSGQSGAGCGGQSGTYVKHGIIGPASSYSCVIGSAGIGGIGGNPGSVGGNTTFAGITAYGGGAGGTTTGSGVNLAFIVSPATTPSGGSIVNYGASSGDGAIVFNSTTAKSGIGASSVVGAGGGQRGTTGNGLSATGYGGGGSGACSLNGAGSFTGGNGSSGCIIVWEYS